MSVLNFSTTTFPRGLAGTPTVTNDNLLHVYKRKPRTIRPSLLLYPFDGLNPSNRTNKNISNCSTPIPELTESIRDSRTEKSNQQGEENDA